MDDRRTLTFNSLRDVMPEVDRLLEGHRTLGKWSLGQICNHLTSSIIGSVDGCPPLAPWVVRKTLGPFIVRWILKTGRMPDGAGLPERALPKPGLDARAEAEALRAALMHFGSHVGPLADHPISGPIPRESWERMHLIHCAHHLGFVVPEPVKVA